MKVRHHVLSALAIAIAIVSTGCKKTEAPSAFIDRASAMGIEKVTYSGSAEKRHIRETLGQGACWLDADGDAQLDLVVLGGGTAVYADERAQRDALQTWTYYHREGPRFVDRTREAGFEIRGWGLGCATGDVDGDGRDDVFVTTAVGPNELFVTTPDGRFERRTERSGLGDDVLSTGAAFGDLDGDGDLDLFVATYLDESRPPDPRSCRWKGTPVMCGPKGYPMMEPRLYLNDGHGTFVRVREGRGLEDVVGFGLGVIVFDAEGDGDLDVFVANDSSPSRLFVNDGHAKFEDRGFGAGVAMSESGALQAGMGVDVADLDGDGRLDLLKTNFSDDVNNFFRSTGPLRFVEWSYKSGLAGPTLDRLGWAILSEDFDLDGDADVLVVNGHVFPEVDEHDPATTYLQRMQLFLNDGAGRLVEAREGLGPAFDTPMAGRSAAIADFDLDGDADVLVTRDRAAPLLLENRLPPPGHRALRVELHDAPGNPHGLGATVEVRFGDRRAVRLVAAQRGYLSSSQTALTFGLGKADRADDVTVTWPDGTTESFGPVPGNRAVSLRRGTKKAEIRALARE